MAIYSQALDIKLRNASITRDFIAQMLDVFDIQFIGSFTFCYLDRELEKLKHSPGYVFTLPSGRRDAKWAIYYTETDPEKIIKLGAFW